MKTAPVVLCTATLLGFATVVGGRPIDAPDFLAIAFAAGLVAWTLTLYSKAPRALLLARPICLPVTAEARRANHESNDRVAA